MELSQFAQFQKNGNISAILQTISVKPPTPGGRVLNELHQTSLTEIVCKIAEMFPFFWN